MEIIPNLIQPRLYFQAEVFDEMHLGKIVFKNATVSDNKLILKTNHGFFDTANSGTATTIREWAIRNDCITIEDDEVKPEPKPLNSANPIPSDDGPSAKKPKTKQ